MYFFGKRFLHMPLNMEIVQLIGEIRNYQGRLAIYETEFPNVFHKMKYTTRRRHIKCFIDMYQGMNLSNVRLKKLIEQDQFPQNMREE